MKILSVTGYESKKIIEAAIRHWEDATCLEFEHFNSSAHSSVRQRIYFTNSQPG